MYPMNSRVAKLKMAEKGRDVQTHNVNTLVPGDADFSALSTQIYADNAHSHGKVSRINGRRSGGLTLDGV